MRIYLDNAATTPLLPEVIKTMTDVLTNTYGNPSSLHAEGRNARATIEEARKAVAKAIGASIGEIFFTSGGTESNNMALKCAVRDLGVKRVISSPIEHHCVLHSLERLEKTENIEVKLLPVNKNGRLDLKVLEEWLKESDKKTLVSLMHSNNEIGTMIDIDEVAEICHSHQAFFHTDTVQTIGYFPIDVSHEKISFLSGSAHKFHGPKGIGFIYINHENIINPFVDGGSQERNMRGGTENIVGIAGLAKALQYSINHMDDHKNHITSLKSYFKEKLSSEFSDIQFMGDEQGLNHYKVLNVSFPPSPKAALLLLSLDIAGISASGGSACSSGAEKGSHVLAALNVAPDRKNIRFSFSHLNTKEEIDQVIEKLKTILKKALVS
jgi:Cysteine sulfinate desulfinase/cysteine desulfurase and related enzymes